MNQFNHMNGFVRPVLLNRDSPLFQAFQSPQQQAMSGQLKPGQPRNQQVIYPPNKQTNNLNETLCLENFICPSNLPSNAKNANKSYCNACCMDLPLVYLDEHLRTSKHFNNRKRLNNQLLAVNLFQISKHYSPSLTDYLNKSFVNYNAFTSLKLLGLYFDWIPISKRLTVVRPAFISLISISRPRHQTTTSSRTC